MAVTDIAALTSADAVAAFLQRLSYPTDKRMAIPPHAAGLADGERNIREMQLVSECPDGFLRVVFVQLKSLQPRPARSWYGRPGSRARTTF